MFVQKLTLEARRTGESKSAAGLRPEGIPKNEEGENGLGERGKEGGVLDLNFGILSPFLSLKSPFSADSNSVNDGVKKEKGDLRSDDVSSAMAKVDHDRKGEGVRDGGGEGGEREGFLVPVVERFGRNEEIEK